MLRSSPLTGDGAVQLARRSCPSHVRHVTSNTPPWRPSVLLDEWVQKEARPISLRQLTFFSRNLTASKLLSSANYLRTELPVRLAHRLRDMQTLPYVVVTNPHISAVYELYYKAFDAFRRVKEIKTVEENERYCELIRDRFSEHLTVIPRLATGILECQDLMNRDAMDQFMNVMLRSRISRRVIAEHHLALTETFQSPSHAPHHTNPSDTEVVGKVFLKCNAENVLERCGQMAQELARKELGAAVPVPAIRLEGHLGATFPYILSHLEYMLEELLRNAIQAVTEHFRQQPEHMPAITVLVCEAPQHVIFRFSDQGGGIPRTVLPYIWSFSKGPRRQTNRENLLRVPRMAATMQELTFVDSDRLLAPQPPHHLPREPESLTARPSNLKLGIGLPMCRVFAEYWAGSLELQSLEGYGTDVYLHIPKLGNKNEQLTTRAVMDQV